MHKMKADGAKKEKKQTKYNSGCADREFIAQDGLWNDGLLSSECESHTSHDIN